MCGPCGVLKPGAHQAGVLPWASGWLGAWGSVGGCVNSAWRAAEGFAGVAETGGCLRGHTSCLSQKPPGQSFQLQLPAGLAGRLAAEKEDRDREPEMPEPRLPAADSPTGRGLS